MIPGDSEDPNLIRLREEMKTNEDLIVRCAQAIIEKRAMLNYIKNLDNKLHMLGTQKKVK